MYDTFVLRLAYAHNASDGAHAGTSCVCVLLDLVSSSMSHIIQTLLVQ